MARKITINQVPLQAPSCQANRRGQRQEDGERPAAAKRSVHSPGRVTTRSVTKIWFRAGFHG